MHELNRSALNFGLGKQDFMSLLSRDLDEQESMRVAREEEQERAMYSVSTRSTGLHLILIYRKRGDAFTIPGFKKLVTAERPLVKQVSRDHGCYCHLRDWRCTRHVTF
jgi:hypothetical protein